jgi:hypothetical protein
MPAAATEIPVNPSTAANMAMMKNAMAQRNNCSPPDAYLWICLGNYSASLPGKATRTLLSYVA